MLAACGPDESLPLSAEQVTVFAPLPGQPAGVAYFSLYNSSASGLVLRDVTSPEFASVAMHTTMIEDGMAHMTPLDLLTIAARSQVEFTPGGPHLMLLQPHAELAPGEDVTLQFHFELDSGTDAGAGGVLTVRTALLSR